MFSDTLMIATDAAAGGYGDEELDQNNSEGSPSCITGWLNGWQSFQPGVTGLFSAIDLIQNANTTNRRFKLYGGEGTGGSLLMTKEIAGAGTNGAWRKFEFGDDAAELTSGSTYTIFWEDMASPQVSVGIYIDISGNHYANGRSHFNAAIDFLFKTYMKPAL